MLRSASSECSAYLYSPFHSLCFWFVKVFIVQLFFSALSGFGVVHFLHYSLCFASLPISHILWWLPAAKFVVQFGLVGRVVFSSIGSGLRAGCLTQRAPDAGDSAQISSSFLRLSIFPVGRRSAARPSAGNANR